MATKGSCMCGGTAFQFTGPVEATALCHCTDCQKWSGSAYTANVVTPRDGFSVTKGTPKSYDITGDSGKINKHFFCGTCGSSLYTELEVMPTAVCVKAGALDGGKAALDNKIGVEFYTKDRVGYLHGLAGAKQVEAFGN
ncbi:hypothetical protein G3M48_000760 [Beauveria asiatica]|uniref:CENP-V/GFA domain-containing protein n=1 Tax=Beauveria asiatica TaxID=1069075 RepID=A0AAW0RG31_9HYPO